MLGLAPIGGAAIAAREDEATPPSTAVARATQTILATLSASGLAHTLATQIVVEAMTLLGPGGYARATQSALDVLFTVGAVVRATWQIIDVLVWNYEVAMPSIFPELPGMSYSVIRRPKFYTGVGTSMSGREVRVSYAAVPLWEWDLTWEYLPDQQTESSATASDLKTLIRFFLSHAGSLGGFCFRDPDDCSVVGQPLGVGDGATVNFQLCRNFGWGAVAYDVSVPFEPIGYVDVSGSFNVYLDGVLQSTSSYDIVQTYPVNQTIHFHTAPGAGQVISVDMHYFFYVRFKDDHLDFEKWMDKLWSQRQVTLMSQRG